MEKTDLGLDVVQALCGTGEHLGYLVRLGTCRDSDNSMKQFARRKEESRVVSKAGIAIR